MIACEEMIRNEFHYLLPPTDSPAERLDSARPHAWPTLFRLIDAVEVCNYRRSDNQYAGRPKKVVNDALKRRH